MRQDEVFGIVLIMIVCACSGIGTVYNEWALKNSSLSMHQQNFLIYTIGMSFLLILILVLIRENPANLLDDFNLLTWVSVFMQSISGLLISWMLLHVDSFLKVFTGAVAIPMAGIAAYAGGNNWEFQTTLGTAGIFIAIFMYYAPSNTLEIVI